MEPSRYQRLERDDHAGFRARPTDIPAERVYRGKVVGCDHGVTARAAWYRRRAATLAPPVKASRPRKVTVHAVVVPPPPETFRVSLTGPDHDLVEVCYTCKGSDVAARMARHEYPGYRIECVVKE